MMMMMMMMMMRCSTASTWHAYVAAAVLYCMHICCGCREGAAFCNLLPSLHQPAACQTLLVELSSVAASSSCSAEQCTAEIGVTQSSASPFSEHTLDVLRATLCWN
jgi:hypothetical protein